MDSCIFCKIIKGDIPSRRLAETARAVAFLDINPLSRGHCLVVPKVHAEQVHELTDAEAQECGLLVRRVAQALHQSPILQVRAYNVLQNNGRVAHQDVPHVHFHVIPKTTDGDGLKLRWDAAAAAPDDLASVQAALREHLSQL
jgi:histidine triad (HIT) family protein